MCYLLISSCAFGVHVSFPVLVVLICDVYGHHWVWNSLCICVCVDACAALRVFRGQRSLRRSAQSEREKMHHVGLQTSLPHPGDQMEAVWRLPGGGMFRWIRVRVADGHRWVSGSGVRVEGQLHGSETVCRSGSNQTDYYLKSWWLCVIVVPSEDTTLSQWPLCDVCVFVRGSGPLCDGYHSGGDSERMRWGRTRSAGLSQSPRGQSETGHDPPQSRCAQEHGTTQAADARHKPARCRQRWQGVSVSQSVFHCLSVSVHLCVFDFSYHLFCWSVDLFVLECAHAHSYTYTHKHTKVWCLG